MIWGQVVRLLGNGTRTQFTRSVEGSASITYLDLLEFHYIPGFVEIRSQYSKFVSSEGALYVILPYDYPQHPTF